MYLLIDDTKTFSADIIARTGEAGLDILRHLDITELGIDHDLGNGLDGYDVIKSALKDKCLPSKIEIVSLNPAGRIRIANLLFFNGYNSFDNIHFKLKD